MVSFMERLAEHHSIFLKLLVGRSLPDGMPWSLDEDRRIIAEERLLWASLTDDERRSEQDFMSALWGRRGADRKVAVDPGWGPWAAAVGPEIAIPDAAFGVPSQDFRPAPKGIPDDAPSDMTRTLEWLWAMGFQPVEASSGRVVAEIPVGRLVQEAERLTALLVRRFPSVRVRPFGSPDGIQVRSSWDPVGGRAAVEVVGLDDSLFQG